MTFPALKKSGVEIILGDDRRFSLEVDYPLGDYREPMDDETFYSKFDSMVLPITGKSRRDQIVGTILDLEKIKDIGELTRLII
jgi:2-methylcitrate dehydratase